MILSAIPLSPAKSPASQSPVRIPCSPDRWEPFKHRVRCLMCGSTQSGKSSLTSRLLSPIGVSAQRRFNISDIRSTSLHSLTTGAVEADVGIVVADAHEGMTRQLRQHVQLLRLAGIQHVVFVVNKMDIVRYDQRAFSAIVEAFRDYVAPLAFTDVQCVPVSAEQAANVTRRGAQLQWHAGPTLLTCLQTMNVQTASQELRFAVDMVVAHEGLYKVSGRLLSGTVKTNDKVTLLPSATSAEVARVTGAPVAVDTSSPVRMTLWLKCDSMVVPGEIVCKDRFPAEWSSHLEVDLLWLSADAMLPRRNDAIRTGATTLRGSFNRPEHRRDLMSHGTLAADLLEAGEYGTCALTLERPEPFDPFSSNRRTGKLEVCDTETNEIVGLGFINHALEHASNTHTPARSVTTAERAAQKSQTPKALWFTGLSGSGISTIADALDTVLLSRGFHSCLLDDDNVRQGLNNDLGFTIANHAEHVRRAAEAGKLMTDAGLIVLMSFISPLRSERALVRDLFRSGEFVEIFVDAPLAVTEQTDLEGPYNKSRAGEVTNFARTGCPYEAPLCPDIWINSAHMTPEEAAELIFNHMFANAA